MNCEMSLSTLSEILSVLKLAFAYLCLILSLTSRPTLLLFQLWRYLIFTSFGVFHLHICFVIYLIICNQPPKGRRKIAEARTG